METTLRDPETFLRAMARRYVWDQSEIDALAFPDRIIRRVMQRVEAKDYRDIAAMLAAGQELKRGLAAAMALFPNFPPCEAIKALTYFEGGNLAALSEDERAILVARSKKVGKLEALKIVATSLGPEAS
jgi:hypothetical protein